MTNRISTDDVYFGGAWCSRMVKKKKKNCYSVAPVDKEITEECHSQTSPSYSMIEKILSRKNPTVEKVNLIF